MALSDTFEEFLNYETEVFERLEQKYSEDIRRKAEARYGSRIPYGLIDQQVKWLESRFYSFIDDFYVEKTGFEALDKIYSSILPQNQSRQKIVHGKLDYIDDFERYDAVVLDHCVIFDLFGKSIRQYYDEGINIQDWEETYGIIHGAAERSELYVPSDLTEKCDRKDFLGNIKASKLFIDEFKTIDMTAELDVPPNHEAIEEDLLIGSEAEQLGENVLVLSFDGDFHGAVSHHFDIEAAAPVKHDKAN